LQGEACFIGDAAQESGAGAHKAGGGGGVSAMDSCRPMGSRGLRWAPCGPTAGPVRTWVGPSGSAQIDRIDFLFFFNFLKYIFSTREFQRNSSNSFKALKILRKSQKFLEID
jgi:hypothetical protein